MSFWSKIKSFGRAVNAIATSEDLRQFLVNGGPSASGIDVSADSAMRCAAVFSCVRVIAESMAQLPLPVYERQADGGKMKVPEHPVSVLLNRRPNQWHTPYEFREMLIGHVCLRGAAYAWVNRTGQKRDPYELIPLRPGSVEVLQMPDLSLRYYYTDPKGDRKPVEPGTMLHLRGLSTDGVNGMTPITAYRESVGISLAIERHQALSFKNGAKFRGYLKKAGVLDDVAAKRLREDFDRASSGENSYATPLLEDGLEWVSAGMTDTDAKTIETQKLTRSNIASIFRVPPHMIGDLDRATFSNIEHQSIQFVTSSLAPWCCRLEQAVNRDLILDPESSPFFAEHVLDGLLRGDTLSRYQAHNLAINGGWKNRNEVRRLENMNPVGGAR